MSPGFLFEDISELLHGRGPGVAAVRYESVELLEGPADEATVKVGNQILDMVELCVERLTSCLTEALHDAGGLPAATMVSKVIEFLPSAGAKPFPAHALWPLVPGTGSSRMWLQHSALVTTR